ncbi:MAG TPA: TolC family protein [Bryobacteraceae bacterium]|jgi:outer membrane protein TolC|nr:TolC family protein [Bryobacteraceae bacterium]
MKRNSLIASRKNFRITMQEALMATHVLGSLRRLNRFVGTLSLAFSIVSAALAQSELLTLDEAVRLAVDHNRTIQQTALSAKESDDVIAAAKTQRLPSFKFSSTTGILLTRPTVTFEKGAFGEYPGIGPIPGDTTRIASPRKPTAMLESQVALPLTQQYKIGLNLKLLNVNKRIALEQVRLTRQEVVRQVRQTYYSIVQSQSSLDTIEQNLALLREIVAETGNYVKAGTALNGDLLNVQARLAQAESDKVSLTGPLATQKEQLNLLLGRRIDTDFRVSPTVEATWIPELAEARERAVASRPDLQQARLKVEQADLDRRKKKSESIPDVSLSVSYYSAINVSSTLPRNLAIAGVSTSWEPFDWGRKRHELAQKGKVTQEATLALREMEDKVRIEVGSAHRKMQEARTFLTAARAGQESTRESVRLARVRLRNEAVLMKDVLEAQADLALANERTQKAHAAYWSARADLEKAIGEEQ